MCTFTYICVYMHVFITDAAADAIAISTDDDAATATDGGSYDGFRRSG